MSFGGDKQMAERFKGDNHRSKAVEALAEARSAETAGIEALKKIVDGM